MARKTNAQRRDAMAKTFLEIGTTAKTQHPLVADGLPLSNTGAILDEFYVASELARLADSRQKAAKAKLQMLYEESIPTSVTPKTIVDDNVFFSVTLQMTSGRATGSGGPAGIKFNIQKFIQELKRANISEEIIDSAVEKASEPASPIERWEVLPKEGE